MFMQLFVKIDLTLYVLYLYLVGVQRDLTILSIRSFESGYDSISRDKALGGLTALGLKNMFLLNSPYGIVS